MNLRMIAATFAVLMVTPVAYGQELENPREVHRSGISLDVGGVVFGGVSYDVFLSGKLNLELALGVIAGGGLRYHPMGDDPDVRWSPYIGLFGGLIPEIKLFSDDEATRGNIYVPLGIHYIADSGFSLALELGYMHAFENDDAESFDIPWFGCKLGFRF